MSRCFVIQPFDGGKFDKRFRDTFEPAIKAAGLDPYRVDQDPDVEIPIDAIERGIRESAVCLADVTTDNPNVWYELGYAFASNKLVLMVCCEERGSKSYPFDIQHRTIVSYRSESPSDFESLKTEVTARIKSLLNKSERLEEIAATSPLSEVAGLTQPELAVLAALASDSAVPGDASSAYSLRHEVERAGFTSIGFGLGWRRLVNKGFVESVDMCTPDGEPYDGVRLSSRAWEWVEQNESMFSLKKKPAPSSTFDDQIPF